MKDEDMTKKQLIDKLREMRQRIAKLEVLESTCKQAEKALRDALNESHQRQAEISALLESARALLEYREFEDVARSIFDSCKRLIGATAGYIAVLSKDGSRNEVVFLDSGGLPCTVDPKLPMPIRGLRREAYGKGKPVYDNNFSKGKWVRFIPDGHARLDNVLFAPMVIKKNVVGLLGLANKPGGFIENDTSMASVFAELAAIAFSNKWTLESLERNEEQFRSVVETATDAIISADSSGNVVFWNDAARKIFGYSPDEIVGKSLTLVMPERLSEAHRSGMQRVVLTGESDIIGKPLEMVGLRKDGSEFFVELSLAMWKTRDEVFFTGICRDITKRKRAEERVKNLAKFPSENPYPVLRIAKDGTILYANAAGLPLLSDHNCRIGQVIPSEWCQLVAEVLDSGMRRSIDVEHRGRTFSFAIVPVTDGGYANLYGLDITDRKRAEEALRKAHEQLEQRVEERTAELLKANKQLRSEIEERTKVEKALNHSEASLAEAQRIAHLGNWDWNIITNELRWSDEIYRIFGLTPQEFGATYEAFLDIVHSDDREFVKEAVNKAIYEQAPYGIDHQIIRPDGTERVVHEQGEVFFDKFGRPIRMIGTVHDITEQKKAEDELRKSEERFRTVADFTYDWEYWIGPDGEYIYVSPSCKRITGYPPDEFERNSGLLEEIIHPEDRQLIAGHLGDELKSQEALYLDFRIITRSNEERWIAHRCQPVYSNEGRYLGRRASNRDITDRKRVEEALRESEKELRVLSSQLLTAEEKERKRIARELHDGIGQSLTAIKFSVENALEQIGKGASFSAKALEAVIPQVQEAMQEVRRIIMDLRPSSLDDLGILATINWFCREFEKIYSGIRIEKEINIQEDQVPNALKTVIFRVLQEAMNNIAKHSKADLVQLSLNKTDNNIELAIEDNGQGFDPEEVLSVESSERGFGLSSMRERTELSGGAFNLESVRGGETIIRASWPI